MREMERTKRLLYLVLALVCECGIMFFMSLLFFTYASIIYFSLFWFIISFIPRAALTLLFVVFFLAVYATGREIWYLLYEKEEESE